MPEERRVDIHDCQDWLRSAPLQEVQEFVWWAQGVIDGRVAAQPKRKTRSDVGQKRPPNLEIPFDREQEQMHEPIDLREIAK